jgi:hypothetical protein
MWKIINGSITLTLLEFELKNHNLNIIIMDNIIAIKSKPLKWGSAYGFFRNDYLNIRMDRVDSSSVCISVSAILCDEKPFWNVPLGTKIRYFAKGYVFEILVREIDKNDHTAILLIYASSSSTFNESQNYSNYELLDDNVLNPNQSHNYNTNRQLSSDIIYLLKP